MVLSLAFSSAFEFLSDISFNELAVVKSGNTLKAYCNETGLRIGKFNTKTNKGFINYNTDIYDTPFEYTLRVK